MRNKPKRCARNLVPIALLLAVGFSGCAFPGATDARANEIVGDSCIVSPPATCVLEESTWVVQGLIVKEGAPGTPGLRIDHPSKPILIKGAKISGTEIGIALDGTCQTCSVVIQDSQVEARPIGIAVGQRSPVLGEVRIENTSFRAAAPAEAAQGFPTLGFGVAVDTIHHASALVLRNVQIQAPSQLLGPSLRANDGRFLDLEEVTITGFEFAVQGGWEQVRIRDMEVHCTGERMLPRFSGQALSLSSATIEIDGLTIQDCRDANYEFTPSAISLRALEPGNGEVVMTNLSVVRTGGAVSAWNFSSLHIELFDVGNGAHGLDAQGVSQVTLNDGAFHDLEMSGALVWADQVTVENVSFARIGSNDAGFGPGLFVGAPAIGPEFTPASARIHNSSFIDNVQVGLAVEESITDARYNWWGSASGPWRTTLPRPDGFGDNVSGTTVHTYPHLTAPP